MTTTKILMGIGVVALISGAVVLVSQQRTIAELREADMRTKREVAILAAESVENVKGASRGRERGDEAST